MRIFVLLFNVGTDNEGIYSRKIGDRDEVLMFEEEDDATRFGLMLEAQDFPTASIEEMDEDEIKAFCESVGYEAILIPSGSLEIPPEHNVEETDWEKDNQGSTDPEPTRQNPSESESSSDSSSDEPAELSEDELNRIRRKLEGLL